MLDPRPRLHFYLHIWLRLRECPLQPSINNCHGDEDFVRLVCNIASRLNQSQAFRIDFLRTVPRHLDAITKGVDKCASALPMR